VKNNIFLPNLPNPSKQTRFLNIKFHVVCKQNLFIMNDRVRF